MVTNRQIDKVLEQVRTAIKAWEPAALGKIAEASRDPFRILISCILSQQTKDRVTEEASGRLYRLADRPDTILALGERRIAKTIYPVSFYRTKARKSAGPSSPGSAGGFPTASRRSSASTGLAGRPPILW
jgi:endonuclease-3